MCGYVFSENKDSSFDNFKEIVKLSSLSLRGDNPINFAELPHGHLAHSLFAVSGSSPSIQPKISENFALLYNGEIYNYKSLLREHNLDISLSDTDLLFYLIENLGILEALSKIEGAFSMCILSLKEKKVFLIRDIWGQKPLFFSIDKYLKVSSSFKFLAEYQENKVIDKFNKFFFELLGFVPSKGTIFKNIKKVLPGEIIEINLDDYSLDTKTYKRRKSEMKISDNPDLIFEAIKTSINRQGDVNKCCLAFSGGVDSTIIATAISRLGLSIPLVHLDIPGNESEKENAINIAKKLSLKLEIIKIENINFSFDDFKDFVDFPVDNHGMMMTSLLAKYCSKNGYRVVLTGMGADEYFGGYQRSKYVDFRKNSEGKVSYKLNNSNFSWKNKILLKILLLFNYSRFRSFLFTFLLSRDQESRILVIKKFFQLIIFPKDFILESMQSNEDINFGKFELREILPNLICGPLDTAGQMNNIEFRSPFMCSEIDDIFFSKETIFFPDKKILKNILDKNGIELKGRKKRFSYSGYDIDAEERRRQILKLFLH